VRLENTIVINQLVSVEAPCEASQRTSGPLNLKAHRTGTAALSCAMDACDVLSSDVFHFCRYLSRVVASALNVAVTRPVNGAE
jgi:hypothetical protein